jgi:hypothetical protein
MIVLEIPPARVTLFNFDSIIAHQVHIVNMGHTISFKKNISIGFICVRPNLDPGASIEKTITVKTAGARKTAWMMLIHRMFHILRRHLSSFVRLNQFN